MMVLKNTRNINNTPNIMIVLIVIFLLLVIVIAFSAAYGTRRRGESLVQSKSNIKAEKRGKSTKKVKFSDRVQVREFGGDVVADVGSISLNN